jgi:arylsulfatase A-like enzyme
MEVEHFDRAVGDAIKLLEQSGQLENTIIVVTSDHGMPFARAKATLYDSGTRVPLAIRWPAGIRSPGRVCEGFVNLSDLAPTFLVAAGLKPPAMMTAHTLNAVLSSPAAEQRTSAFIAMERHDGCRQGGKGYPCRAVRTAEFLYIRNYEPDRWPAGDPDKHNCARFLPYGEYDSNPSKLLLMENEDRFQRLHKLAFAKRPAEELYDLVNDAGQLNNIANRNDYAEAKELLSDELQRHLAETKDPRELGLDAPWDYYPYYGNRKNKNWKVDTKP